MIVYIKTLTGKTLSFEVGESDTIQSLKEKIQAEENITTKQQRLLFKNTELDDKQPISQYGIYDEATIYLVVRMSVMNESQSQEASQRSKISLDNKSVVIPGHIALIIQSTQDEIILNMPESSTIKQVKDEIAKSQPKNTEIMLAHDGKICNDNKTLKESGISNNSCITLTCRFIGG